MRRRWRPPPPRRGPVVRPSSLPLVDTNGRTEESNPINRYPNNKRRSTAHQQARNTVVPWQSPPTTSFPLRKAHFTNHKPRPQHRNKQRTHPRRAGAGHSEHRQPRITNIKTTHTQTQKHTHTHTHTLHLELVDSFTWLTNPDLH